MGFSCEFKPVKDPINSYNERSVHFEETTSPTPSTSSSESSDLSLNTYKNINYNEQEEEEEEREVAGVGKEIVSFSQSDYDHLRRFSAISQPHKTSKQELSNSEILEIVKGFSGEPGKCSKFTNFVPKKEFKFFKTVKIDPYDTHTSKKRRKNVSGKKKNNANNNFMIINIEERTKIPKWEDEDVYNRTEVLALPKPLPKGYHEEKECTYWISKKPPPIPKDGKTKSVATPRVEELAKSHYYKGEFVGLRHCLWEEEYEQPKGKKFNPDNVNWDRLATPKQRMDLSFNNPYRPVCESALKFEATKRLHQLAVPKKKIDCDSFYLWLWNRQPDDKEKLHEVKQLSVDRTDMEDARILLRCDLDFTEGKIIERKIKSILPTIQWAFKKKARSVIIISHVGFPNGARDPKLSLEHLMPLLQAALPDNHIVFLDNCIGAEAIALCEDPEAGHIFLLENLRFHSEELGYKINDAGEKVPCKKEAMVKFRDTLLSFGDVYVNDAFTLLDTDCTTNFGDPKKERCYGLHVKTELMVYNHFIVKHKKKRLVAVLGGTYEQVADIVSSLMGKASEILLGGDIAMMFLHTVKGVDVGEHECSPYHQKKIKDMMTRARDTNTIINMPSDLVLEHVDTPNCYYTGQAKEGIDDYYRAVDIGPLTRQCYTNIMLTADLLIWHGRMGSIPDGTAVIAKVFSEAEDYRIQTYLLDKDTLAIFRILCPAGKVSHITEKSEVTMMLLHRKTPKGLSSLNPYRKKTKKRPPKEVWVSAKPTTYDRPCMKMCNAMDRLSIDDLDLNDKKVIIRCNLDIPVKQGEIVDNFLLRMVIPSIRYALQCGARAVVIVAALGNPTSVLTAQKSDQATTSSQKPPTGQAAAAIQAAVQKSEQYSLKPVAAQLAGFLNISGKAVIFVPDPNLTKVKTILKDCYPGTVVMLENINFKEEEMAYNRDIHQEPQKAVEKVNTFCEELSRIGDAFINDTFNNLLVKTSSLCGFMGRQRACGFLLKNELRYMSNAFNAPRRPILVIMGGKYSRAKITALKSLLREVDEVIITGRMAMAFLKVVNNMPTGSSVILEELAEQIPGILKCAADNSVRFIYPVDFVVSNELRESSIVKQQSASLGVPENWFAADIGYNTSSLFKQAIKRSKMVLWHGVVGHVECPLFAQGTKKLLDVLSSVTQDPDLKVVSIVGGNSLLSFIHNVQPDQGVSHISTGGVTCAAIIKDRCLPVVQMLTAGSRPQSLTRMTVDQTDITRMPVLLRANLDAQLVPEGETQALADGSVVKLLVPSIRNLQKRGAKSITIVGTLGNPDGKKDEALSLMPVKLDLEKKLKQEVRFFEYGVNDSLGAISNASDGQLFMLENLAFHPEEKGWDVDDSGERQKMSYADIDAYRKKLSDLGQVFVNESMASLNQCDSSVVGISCKMRVGGPLLKTELSKLRTFLNKKSLPLMVIVGANKKTDLWEKMSHLYELLDHTDVTQAILVGEIAYSYIRYTTPNAKLGGTPIDADNFKLWPKILSKARLNGVVFHTPVDFLIDDKIEVPVEDPDQAAATPAPPPSPGGDDEQVVGEVRMEPIVKTLKEGIPVSNRAMDIGPKTVEDFNEKILQAQSIILMGPAGEYEEEDYGNGCIELLASIKEAMTEGQATSIGLGVDTYLMLEYLESTDTLTHVSLATLICINILKNILMPGLEALDSPPVKPLKKLRLDNFNLSGKRVLLRLDLDIPMVDGVVLDTSRIDAALTTVRYLLEKNVKCIVIVGHRGRPNGYKNAYLSLEPLAAEFAKYLDVLVNFLPYPCSAKTREILADPKPKSVYLMENLKFYPAEETDDEVAPVIDEDQFQMEEGEEGEEDVAPETPKEPEENQEAAEGEEDEVKSGQDEAENEEDKEKTGEENQQEVEEEEENDEFVMFDDPENLDRVMFEQMAPKNRKRYVEELSECGDVFVNDNVKDLQSNLASMTSLTCKKCMCGLLVKEFLMTTDIDDVYTYKSVMQLSPAPPEGVIDDLILE